MKAEKEKLWKEYREKIQKYFPYIDRSTGAELIEKILTKKVRWHNYSAINGMLLAILRHNDTHYEFMLNSGIPRKDARIMIEKKIRQTMEYFKGNCKPRPHSKKRQRIAKHLEKFPNHRQAREALNRLKTES